MRSLTNYAYRILREISFPRLAGSEGEEKAREIIVEELSKLGVPVSEHSFSLWTFRSGDGRITLKNRLFKAIPYGNTKPFDEEGEITYVEDLDYLSQDVKGKIVVTYGRVRGESYERLIEKGVKGLISISPPERGFSFSSISQRFVEEGKVIPALVVEYDTGLKLKEAEGERVKIQGSTEYYKGTAVNIITEIKGSKKPDEIILLCGHYDSVAISPGATDNAGGSAILLALAKHFSRRKPKRTLRFVWFSGEELGLLGSQAYVEEIKDELKKIKMVINLDVAGDPIGENGAMCISEKDTLNFVSILSKEKGIPFKTRLDIYSSDSMPFALYGVPSINLARFGGKGSFYIHSHNDRFSYTGASGLAPVIEMTLSIVERLDNSVIFPLERRISGDLKGKIEDYFKKMQGKKVEVRWEK
ncbi:MAG: M20/M25/M40 family metallo-hydrolase [bacterium]|nr:M20/M25/M40 family metallo-hydrolase [bacterium]